MIDISLQAEIFRNNFLEIPFTDEHVMKCLIKKENSVHLSEYFFLHFSNDYRCYLEMKRLLKFIGDGRWLKEDINTFYIFP